MKGTFTPETTGPMTFLQEAEGNVFTPFLPGSNSQVILLLSDEDMATFDGSSSRAKTRVTDLMTGKEHTIKRAPCGLGCRCAAEIVLPS